jgi:hypothetical protein
LRVDPQRPAQAQSGPVDDLAEARQKVQSRLHPLTNLIDPNPAGAVEQPGLVDHGEGPDVPRPAEIVAQDGVVIRCSNAQEGGLGT